MSRRMLYLVVPAVALVLALGIAAGAGVRALGLSTAPRDVAAAPATPVPAGDALRTINVTGAGSVSVTPDLAYVTFGVETTGTDLAQAQSANATAMTAVLDKLKSLGIAAADLRTTGYSVAPQYDRDQHLTGYRVANGVVATVRDLKALGSDIDQAVAAGATRVQGIAFDVSNKADAIGKAREAAVNDARAKAEQYAKLTNVQLGAPVTITEGSAPPPQPIRQPAAAPAGAAPTTPIEPGENTITVTVQITYEIR
ncbi:MAG TPA: SIMPL domain-containing protein [Thermomicrobiales bacterium]|nr:SIMPL domain-containing protein [Thermomicrobiales bacterium]